MREDLLNQVEQEFEQRRLAHEREEQQRLLKIRQEQEEVYRLVAERQELIYGSIRGILDGRKAGEDLPERMEKLSARIREALKAHGYPEDYLSPIHDCEICQDTGYTGEPVRRMCSCLEKAYQEKLRAEIGLNENRKETFENYDETLFPAEPEEGQPFSQRSMNRVFRNNLERWANDWPGQSPRDIVLSGPSGVGKTYFLRAMAARLIERGCGVLILSAYAFLEIARKSYFGEDDGLRELMEAQVLMIDDLGSEPMMKNITIEQLFNLINERQRKNLPTVISTNLGEEELRERYTERIMSRLTDRRNCEFFKMPGRDIRTGRK